MLSHLQGHYSKSCLRGAHVVAHMGRRKAFYVRQQQLRRVLRPPQLPCLLLRLRQPNRGNERRQLSAVKQPQALRGVHAHRTFHFGAQRIYPIATNHLRSQHESSPRSTLIDPQHLGRPNRLPITSNDARSRATSVHCGACWSHLVMVLPIQCRIPCCNPMKGSILCTILHRTFCHQCSMHILASRPTIHPLYVSRTPVMVLPIQCRIPCCNPMKGSILCTILRRTFCHQCSMHILASRPTIHPLYVSRIPCCKLMKGFILCTILHRALRRHCSDHLYTTACNPLGCTRLTELLDRL